MKAALRTRFLLMSFLCVHLTAQLPTGMPGVWAGDIVASPTGSTYIPGGMPDFLVVSNVDAQGNLFMRHNYEGQLMRVQGAFMQYCFNYDHPKAHFFGDDEAPFVVVPSSDEQELKLCWRGRRLPSHKANCTGCSCAQWTLRVNGDHMQSTFLQSPPAVHLNISLKRTGPPPHPEVVRAGWDCQFHNHTGDPNYTQAQTIHARRSPRTGVRDQPLLRTQTVPVEGLDDVSGEVSNCLYLGNPYMVHQHGIKFEYVAAKTPCMPCDVRFTVSMNMPAADAVSSYFAIGFKERYAAYYDWDRQVYDVSEYWGMSSGDANVADLTGRILVGYISSSGASCIRQMRANAYVGSVVDVEDDGMIRDATFSVVDGRAGIKFTASIHAGKDSKDLSWYSGSFGQQRVQWAIGPIPSEDGCSAPLNYHSGSRMQAALGFPGFGTPCATMGSAATGDFNMLDSDPSFIV